MKNRRLQTIGTMTGALFTGALLMAGPLTSGAGAQDLDTRWLPWLGCWEGEASVQPAGDEAPMLCITPLPGGEGVRLETFTMGELVSTEAIHTDGEPRQVEREGCVGMEEGEFSADGDRVYLRSSFVCEGGTEQTATGLLAMLNPMQWVDVKVVDVEEGGKMPLVMKYRLARSSRVETAGVENVVAPRAMAVKAARIRASSSLTVNDIMEANGKVDPEAVQALIVERAERFDLDADALVRLADAGVPSEVIDVAVATSYPDHFTLDAGAPQKVADQQAQAMAYPGTYRGRWGFWDPFYYPYHGFGYSPFSYGFGYGGYYGGWYRPRTIVVDYEPRSTLGRIIKGAGYTRGGSGSDSGSRGTARPRGGGSSSGGAVKSSGGSSSGRSGAARSTGRKAKRRSGGGGGL